MPEQLKQLNLDQLTDLYKQLNPHAAPNYKFPDQERGINQLHLAATYVLENESQFAPEKRHLAKRVKGLVPWDEVFDSQELPAEALTGDTNPAPEPKTKEQVKKSMSEGTKASWTNAAVRKARCSHNKVSCDGQVFRSVMEAAKTKGIPEKHHVSLRKVVKLQQHVMFHCEGKDFEFVLLGNTGEDIGAAAKPVVDVDVKDVAKLARTLQLPAA